MRLMEGSETILALLLFCLFANQFWWLAWLVALWALGHRRGSDCCDAAQSLALG